MNTRNIVLGIVAIVCAGSATLGVNHIRNRVAKVKPIETVPVLTAKTNVARGTLITEDVLGVQNWPKAMVPAGAILDAKEALQRAVVVPLVVGEPILEAKLANKDAGRGLAAMIPKGMRAFTINTPHIASGVGGFILPGNRVDILLTTNSRDEVTGGSVTTTLLQNTEILAVATHVDAPTKNAIDPIEVKSVTLLVSPDQAAKLDLAMNSGQLHLSLRNPEDEAQANTRPAFLKDIRFRQENATLSRFASTLGTLMGALSTAAVATNKAEPLPVGTEASDGPMGSIHILRGSHRGGAVRVERRP